MVNDQKPKRAAKRYPYPHMAQCEVDGQLLEIQMLNISTSGIQFASRSRVESKNPVKVLWKDAKHGSFDPTLLIAREIHKPENKDFQYYYGSQYYNLTPEIKQSLLIFLKNFRDEEKKEAKKQVEHITPKAVLETVDEGAGFLRRAFDGGSVPSYFDNLMKEIKEYERMAFLKEDAVSVGIQKLTTHNFHCNLFGMLTPFMIEKNDLQPLYFQRIQIELEQIIETENEIEVAVKKLLDSESDDDEKKNIQKLVNESSNRLFYTKQGLLQSIVEIFGSVDLDLFEFKDSLSKIKEEFERINEFTNASFQDDPATYKRRTKKPSEYSKADAIMDIPVMSDTKPRYMLWFNVFFIFVFIIGYGFYRFTAYQDRVSLKDKIGIDIDVKEFNRMGSQVDITVPKKDWDKLPPKHREDTLNKIIIFLQKDKGARSCVLFDSGGGIIKILYKDMKPLTSAN